MSIKDGLKHLNSLSSRYAQKAYDYTTFHEGFAGKNKLSGENYAIHPNVLDVTFQNILQEMKDNRDEFMNINFQESEGNNIRVSKIYRYEHSLKQNIGNQNNHLTAWIRLLTNKKLITPELIEKYNSIIEESNNILKITDFDPLFEAKVKIISNQMKTSHHQQSEKEFLEMKFNILKKEYPTIDLLKTAKQLLNYKKNYNSLVKESYEKVISENPDEFLSMADLFIKQQSFIDNDLQYFIVNKQNGIEVAHEFKFSKSQIIEEVYIFKDDSIVINKNGNYSKITNSDDLKSVNTQAFSDGLDYLLRKNPNVRKLFKNKFNEDKAFNASISAASSFIDNEGILKSQKFNMFELTDKSFEGIDDAINSVVQKHKVELFAKSILSHKYKHLLNVNTFPYFENLYNENFSEQDLQKYIGKKLASIKTDDDLITMLKNTVKVMNGFNLEAVLEKLEKLNINPLINENGILTFEVPTYSSCVSLGSPSWCIVRDEHYFDDYLSNEERQYICYDFNKDSTDIESMIGFTLTKDGFVRAAHYKNDDEIYTDDEFISEIVNKSLYLNKESHSIKPEMEKTLEKQYSSKEKEVNNELKVKI